MTADNRHTGPGTGGLGVRCEGLVHLYPGNGTEMDSVVALRGVDLQVEPGEFVVLLGPSGSGKSTILGLLAGVLRPSAGRVIIGTHDITHLAPRDLARLRGSLVATVLQSPPRNLLPYATVMDNLRYAAQPNTASIDPGTVLNEYDLAGIADRVAGRLSGGEQQRVGIAAALCGGARLLLADEPTSQMDTEGRDTIIDMLHRANQRLGVTVIAVTHDRAIARESGRTITIRDGRVGAEGNRGREFAIVARDGSLQLPPELRQRFEQGTLLEVESDRDSIHFRRPAP